MRSPAPPTVRLADRAVRRRWHDPERLRFALFVALLLAAVATA